MIRIINLKNRNKYEINDYLEYDLNLLVFFLLL